MLGIAPRDQSHDQRRLYASCFAAVLSISVALLAKPSLAAFTTFAGNASQYGAWLSAVGTSVPLETFESFTGVSGPGTGGSVLTELPSVRIRFDPIAPGVYDDGGWAHSGTKQWSNWAGGAGNAATHVMRPDPGLAIFALGFWNTDPQGDQPMFAYSARGEFVGSISGKRNTHNGQPLLSEGFAGFISTTPIALIVIPGALGDGWNHFDDLQVLTRVTADYNHNGIVDTADYVIWRRMRNQTGPNLAADGAPPDGVPDGVVNQADYNYWRAHFGELAAAPAGGLGASSFVPEPNLMSGFVWLVILLYLRQRRKWGFRSTIIPAR